VGVLNLNETYDEILKRLDSVNIVPFPGTPVIDETAGNIIIWDPESDDWKSFIDVAKKEGAASMIVAKGESTARHPDEIGSITLVWIKDGITYIFRKRAEWWNEEFGGVEDQSAEEDNSVGESAALGEDRGGKSEKKIRPPLPKSPAAIRAELAEQEVRTKKEEQLAAELVTFLARKFPRGLDQIPSSEICSPFWARKGINFEEIDDPRVRMKIRKAERLAQQRFLQARSLEIQKKSDEDLAREEIDFLKKHLGEGRDYSYMDADLFWETKGAVRYTAEPGLRFKIEKVDAIVRDWFHGSAEMRRGRNQQSPQAKKEASSGSSR
jgi:hypothetical protein